MALSDDVIDRISDARLRQLTRPWEPEGVDVQQAMVTRAVSDVEGRFLSMGVTYDSTDKAHVPVGVDGVVAMLLRYSGKDRGDRRYTAFENGLKGLIAPVTPETTGELEPSPQVRAGKTRRPDFDESVFDEAFGTRRAPDTNLE